jgi:hypothetical protein
MKCSTHGTEATAICAYCGRALCPECAKPGVTGRMICSTACDQALSRADKAMDLVLQKSLQNARANAFYFYFCGALSFAGAVGAYFFLPVPLLIWFAAGSGVVFIVSGIWYDRIARKQSPDS